MAERSNAHDSKSCDAGMYPRVQIPFSAPNNPRGFPLGLFGIEKVNLYELFSKDKAVFSDCFITFSVVYEVICNYHNERKNYR